jgi:hypothetical protein
MSTVAFEKELAFFIENQQELVKKHMGKILVIKGEKVIGVYPTALEAYVKTQKKHPLGSFMLQPCLPGPEAYTTTVTSTKIA